jgi:hypothetical protein
MVLVTAKLQSKPVCLVARMVHVRLSIIFGTAKLQLPITFWFSISGSEGKKKYRKDKPWDHEGIDHWKPVLLSIASARCFSALL